MSVRGAWREARWRWALALGPLILACGGALSAAPPPPSPLGLAWRGEALHVKARHLVVDLVERRALLEGEVELRRADATLRCPRVEVRFDDKGQVTWARGEGGVSLEARDLRAEASEARFDVAGQVVALRGGVRLQRGGVRLEAAQASLDLARQQVDLSDVQGAIAASSSSSSSSSWPSSSSSSSSPARP